MGTCADRGVQINHQVATSALDAEFHMSSFSESDRQFEVDRGTLKKLRSLTAALAVQYERHCWNELERSVASAEGLGSDLIGEA